MKIPKSSDKSMMKIFIFLIFVSIFYRNANSNIINVSAGDVTFEPAVVHAAVGDKIKWTFTGSHFATIVCDGVSPGTVLPLGAAAWNETLSNSNPVFEYYISVAGTYNYTGLHNQTRKTARIIAESPLPVELTDFVATTIKNEVILDWSTGGELNNDRFEIQRVEVKNTKDNPMDLDFVTVGVMNGNGTINHSHDYRYIDRNLKSGKYMYRLRQVDFNSNYIYHLLNEEIVIGIPSKFFVSQNYPNPFNPVTRINYELPYDGNVNILLIDATGRLVATLVNGNLNAGYQTLEINGSEFSSGAYYYRIEYNGGDIHQSVTRKMLLIK